MKDNKQAQETPLSSKNESPDQDAASSTKNRKSQDHYKAKVKEGAKEATQKDLEAGESVT